MTKKILLSLFILLLLIVAGSYLLIPGGIRISSSMWLKANSQPLFHSLQHRDDWNKWWPPAAGAHASDSSQAEAPDSSWEYDGFRFRLAQEFYNAFQLSVRHGHDSFPAVLKIVPFTTDSMGLEISADRPTSGNPLKRIATWYTANKLKRAFDSILLRLGRYAGDVKNFYGLDIRREKVQFQFLVSMRKRFDHYPATGDIYAIVDTLRSFAAARGARELFYPMLNITADSVGGYVAQLGLPVDRSVNDDGAISQKQMMKGGNILAADVNGGTHRIEEARKKVEQYIQDYQRTIIAIPFQMLITDRRQEPDSSRWVTRIYYPVV
ncbi:MAG TPA: hypothetical protein VGC95_13350 [Chitinophagaceae bacterium]